MIPFGVKVAVIFAISAFGGPMIAVGLLYCSWQVARSPKMALERLSGA